MNKTDACLWTFSLDLIKVIFIALTAACINATKALKINVQLSGDGKLKALV